MYELCKTLQGMRSDPHQGGIMGHLTQHLVQNCKGKLLEAREEILNRVREGRKDLISNDGTTGDEADQTARVLAESEFVANQERLRMRLMEIDMALSRIADGSYGICEETDELIEPDRLLAIPWTRLSIEGAEIRENTEKRYAR